MSQQKSSSKNEKANTYMVQDARQKKAELHRLDLQDAMITSMMGRVLSEQQEPSTFRRILDIACGTGGWILQAAQTYPDLNLVGVDISSMLIEYALTRVKGQDVQQRVTFEVMDALKGLDFPENSFDLVNLRFGASFIRTWDWPRLLLEMQRVVRPGGIVRVTEFDMGVQGTSQALSEVYEIGMQALYRAGHYFTQDAAGITGHLEDLLTKSWCDAVQTKTYPLVFQAGNPLTKQFKENARLMHQTITPFAKKLGVLPENFEDIYQQSQADMEKSDFSATWNVVTAWGSKPLLKTTSHR